LGAGCCVTFDFRILQTEPVCSALAKSVSACLIIIISLFQSGICRKQRQAGSRSPLQHPAGSICMGPWHPPEGESIEHARESGFTLPMAHVVLVSTDEDATNEFWEASIRKDRCASASNVFVNDCMPATTL